jgi:predicted nicotinamide N-methyase
MLRDVDQTIDQLFELYVGQGKTELFEEMCPYFGTLWSSGKVLALYFEQQLSIGQLRHPIGSSHRVLEIGCGLALPSLYLAKRGWQVSATDLHPDVPLFLTANKQLNGIDSLQYLALDWRISTFDSADSKKWDLIFASDVLYDKTQPETLSHFIDQNLSVTGRAVIADPGRTYIEIFFDLLRSRGFDVTLSGMFGVIIAEISRKGSGPS